MSKKQKEMNLGDNQEQPTELDKYEFEPIQGYPMLRWKGKRPFRSTQYYPAQLKEVHGLEVEGWRNKIYWGDNLQVMSHLLKEYRGKVDLIYIDPPFDSKADYKKTVKMHQKSVSNERTSFEEKQYSDIWTNDEYLQFMYERLILLRELISETGSIYVHSDYNKSHHIRMILDEAFGEKNIVNEIIWRRKQATSYARKQFGVTTDTILWYAKGKEHVFNPIYTKDDKNTRRYIEERFVHDDGDGRKYMKSPLVNSMYRPNLRYDFHGIKPPPNGWLYKKERMEKLYRNNELVMPSTSTGRIYRKIYKDQYKGQLMQNIWLDIPIVNPMAIERENYPTQKPEALLSRIIEVSSKPDDIVLDVFMGSGTTQAVAMKLGRRFIGADINLGSIQTTTKRLIKAAEELEEKQNNLLDSEEEQPTYYTGFEVYNVNHYDIFRNPVEAKELLIEALEIQKLETSNVYDGEKDGRMVKIMPVNRIATKADLNDIIANMDYKAFERRQAEHPTQPVEKLLIVCMGHEPDLAATLQNEVPFPLDIEVVDILRDKSNLEFKRDAEAKVVAKDGKLVIEQFYPMNLLQKLSLMKENVEDWRELVESVMVDWNYDGAVLEPAVVDLPDKNELVKGEYEIPEEAGTIMVKITDLLSESLEVEVQYG